MCEATYDLRRIGIRLQVLQSCERKIVSSSEAARERDREEEKGIGEAAEAMWRTRSERGEKKRSMKRRDEESRKPELELGRKALEFCRRCPTGSLSPPDPAIGCGRSLSCKVGSMLN